MLPEKSHSVPFAHIVLRHTTRQHSYTINEMISIKIKQLYNIDIICQILTITIVSTLINSSQRQLFAIQIIIGRDSFSKGNIGFRRQHNEEIY